MKNGDPSEEKTNVVSLDRRRILTNEDFALIEKLKEAHNRRLNDPRFRSKNSRFVESALNNFVQMDEDVDEKVEQAMQFAVNPDALAPQAKTGKASKIERIARILEGRKENRFEHEGHAGGLTNKEKLRKKNYVMVRKGKREVANKIRTSNSTARWNAAHRVS
jgi:hypothetical protein